MKTYNTLCGLIWIIIIMAVLVYAAYKTEQPTQIPTVTTTMETTTEASEPQPTPYIRYNLTEEERDIVERVVMAETENQPQIGQMAVAWCILNTAEATGQRPDAVILAPNQYAPPAEDASDSVKQAVSFVFDEGIPVADEPIRYFYAPKHSSGGWHESALEYVCTINDHKFFKIPE